MAGSPTDARKAIRAGKILDAASRLFFEHGFDSVNMDMIAATAAMSKVTIYKYYPHKKDILFEVASKWLEAANRIIWPNDMDEDEDIDLFLSNVMRNFYRVFLTSDAIAARRMVLGALPKYPELGDLVFTKGPAVILDMLERYFIRMSKAGRMAIDRPSLAAVQFHGLMQSDVELRGIYLGQLPSEREIELRVRSSVLMFVSYYAKS
jgi:TetR/AcrR family transcriptional regulator, mexJK operon transcriptional repressor